MCGCWWCLRCGRRGQKSVMPIDTHHRRSCPPTPPPEAPSVRRQEAQRKEVSSVFIFPFLSIINALSLCPLTQKLFVSLCLRFVPFHCKLQGTVKASIHLSFYFNVDSSATATSSERCSKGIKSVSLSLIEFLGVKFMLHYNTSLRFLHEYVTSHI